MAKSIKLGADTYLDASGVVMSDHTTLDASHTGYTKLPDGTLIQYGEYNFGGAQAGESLVTTITLPVAFLGSAYKVCVTAIRNGIWFEIGVCDANGYDVRTNTSFSIRVKNTYTAQISTNVSWIAIGKWK